MNEMIEAAARAMVGAQWDLDRKAGFVQLMTRQEWMDEYWPKMAALLPAALRAMMEVPVTDGMYGKWMGGSPPFTQDWRDSCNRDWRALLGAIIGEVE